MCICEPNKKFLCLNLWLGEVYIPMTTMQKARLYKALWLINQMTPEASEKKVVLVEKKKITACERSLINIFTHV